MKNKYLLTILIVLIVGIALFGTNAILFQGKLFGNFKDQAVNNKFLPKQKENIILQIHEEEKLSTLDIKKYEFIPLCLPAMIDIENNLNQTLTIDYCTYLENDNGMRIYFKLQNNILYIYSTNQVNGQFFVLDSTTLDNASSYFNSAGNSIKYYSPLNSLTNGEVISINTISQNELEISISNMYLQQHSLCNFIPESLSQFTITSINKITFYIANDLSNDVNVQNAFSDKIIEKNTTSITFLENTLGFFPPVPNVLDVYIYNPQQTGISYAAAFIVRNIYTTPITQSIIDNIQYGNTHEYTHSFFSGINVERSWFEEGLADLMEHKIANSNNYRCDTTGWQAGYYDNNNNFIANSVFVPYSDFSINPQQTSDFYDPLNQSSYYRSAECFWIYIEENYGTSAITNIATALHNSRLNTPPIKQYLIRDFANPTLGVDLSQLVLDRYNYTEN